MYTVRTPTASSLGGGSRFRVLEDLESDDCASGAAARPRKTALRQESASSNERESCCRRQDDDASVSWSGVRGPSAIRSDVQGRAMTRSIGISLVSGQPGNCKRNFQFFGIAESTVHGIIKEVS